ncbi:hypothetical protein DdX_17596 [Ditylenchus destructor]|uniref:Uncharacterized protein n=1 Tax=Ditylenchus destructor TaxID=166010 RepID=A0AAD4QZ11_9BILA|nr:hypothetical protein DdX_17596 [Ditylenchus destructor]
MFNYSPEEDLYFRLGTSDRRSIEEDGKDVSDAAKARLLVQKLGSVEHHNSGLDQTKEPKELSFEATANSFQSLCARWSKIMRKSMLSGAMEQTRRSVKGKTEATSMSVAQAKKMNKSCTELDAYEDAILRSNATITIWVMRSPRSKPMVVAPLQGSWRRKRSKPAARKTD